MYVYCYSFGIKARVSVSRPYPLPSFTRHCYSQYQSVCWIYVLMTSSKSEIQEVAPLVGLNEKIKFTIDEGEVIVLEGNITSVEVAISRRCCRCQAWQQDFEGKVQFHLVAFVASDCSMCKHINLQSMPW